MRGISISTFRLMGRCDETFHRRRHKVTFLRMFPRSSFSDVVACMGVYGYIYEVTKTDLMTKVRL